MITTPHPDVLRQEREDLLARMTTLTPLLPGGALPGFHTGRSPLKVLLEVHFPEPLAYGRFGREEEDPDAEVPSGGWWERTPGGLRLTGPSPLEGCSFWLPSRHEEAVTEALQSRHATLAGIATLARRLDLRPRPQDVLADGAAWRAAAGASGLSPAEREKGMRMVAGLFWSWLAVLDPEMRPYRLRMPSAFVGEEEKKEGEIAFLKTNGGGPSMKVEVLLPARWPSLLQGASSIYWTSGEEPRAFRSLRGDPPLPLGPMDTPSGWFKVPKADLRRGPHDWKAEFLMHPRALQLDWDETAYSHWTIKERAP